MKQNTFKTLKFFWKQAMAYKLVFGCMTAALLVGVLSSMAWAILFREFFAILTGGGSQDVIVAALISILLYIVALESLEWVGWRTAHFLNNYFQPRVMSNIANKCFEYIHGHSYRFFSNNFVGSLVKKVNRMIGGFERVADKLYWDMFPLVLRILIIGAVLFYLHPLLGAIMGVWTVIFVFVQYKLSRFKLRYDIPRAAMDSKVTAALADTISNSINIKLFAALKYELKRFTKITDKWFRITRTDWNVGAYIEAGQAALMILLEFAIMYSAIRLWQNGLLKVADFFLIQAYLFEIFHQLWNFGRNLRDLYEALADSEEMTEILITKHEIADTTDAKILQVGSGKVEFKKVYFSYGEGESVLKNLSFSVKSGQKVALIGPSGGGKSTIVKLLLRLFDLQKGEILVDGQNIADVTQQSLREEIALVPQDPILFYRTLKENIRYGKRNASDKEILAASKMAHCHEFINRFPRGYETYVGERGVKLSGGQRQRVAIARAILSNAKILILDEATSSLDSESEALIQDALMNLMKQKTTFIIAHRLSTIMRADKIFVLEGGKIIEDGSHSDLVGKKSGLYKRLWDLQVGGYL
ncbi:ABC transporter ATP-binding protein [Candidatus Peregrinibacteria bacterium]|nr:ABC transporter ATP-binding protein [Candidatus Peregrinibacteria bacterium]